jgi:metal-responsive CopG/Arc/MetJ family transcriptional regulator
MPSKPVQISIDSELLRRIDQDPEARTNGRSAFVRSVVRVYLAAKEQREIEAELLKAYRGQADSLLNEVAELLAGQSWPKEWGGHPLPAATSRPRS